MKTKIINGNKYLDYNYYVDLNTYIVGEYCIHNDQDSFHLIGDDIIIYDIKNYLLVKSAYEDYWLFFNKEIPQSIIDFFHEYKLINNIK